MITQLTPIEWGRLRLAASVRTVAELRTLGTSGLYAIAKRTDQNKNNYVSEAIARECEKWCKPARA